MKELHVNLPEFVGMGVEAVGEGGHTQGDV